MRWWPSFCGFCTHEEQETGPLFLQFPLALWSERKRPILRAESVNQGPNEVFRLFPIPDPGGARAHSEAETVPGAASQLVSAGWPLRGLHWPPTVASEMWQFDCSVSGFGGGLGQVSKPRCQ